MPWETLFFSLFHTGEGSVIISKYSVLLAIGCHCHWYTFIDVPVLFMKCAIHHVDLNIVSNLMSMSMILYHVHTMPSFQPSLGQPSCLKSINGGAVRTSTLVRYHLFIIAGGSVASILLLWQDGYHVLPVIIPDVRCWRLKSIQGRTRQQLQY